MHSQCSRVGHGNNLALYVDMMARCHDVDARARLCSTICAQSFMIVRFTQRNGWALVLARSNHHCDSSQCLEPSRTETVTNFGAGIAEGDKPSTRTSTPRVKLDSGRDYKMERIDVGSHVRHGLPAFICPCPYRASHASALQAAPRSRKGELPRRRLRSRRVYVVSVASSGRSGSIAVWERLNDCDVLVPASPNPPTAMVHFMGGLGAGAAPRTLYAGFLERVACRAGVAVVATPVGAGFDHDAIACEVAEKSGKTLDALRIRWGEPNMPAFGVGHSFGSKLLLLMGSDDELRTAGGKRAANVLVSFNNFSAAQSIPMLEQIRTVLARGSASVPPDLTNLLDRLKTTGSSRESLESLGVSPSIASVVSRATKVVSDVAVGLGAGEFSPTGEEVLRRVAAEYDVQRNLVISFTRDSLDCSDDLVPVLQTRFGSSGIASRRLPGTHITPNTPDIDSSNMRSVGVGAVDESVRGATESALLELDDAVTVIVAFLKLNLQLPALE